MSARALLAACCWLVASACMAATNTADTLVQAAGFDQHLNATVPLGLMFRDEDNQTVRLADYFRSAPVVLLFSYYGCTTLCPTVIENLFDDLDKSGLTAGIQYQVVVVSIDPHDSPALAALKKAAYLNHPSSNTGRGWHLLTGNGANISALAEAVGFRYAYDAATEQYAHPAGLVLLTSEGRIARYLFGFDFTAAELRRALDETSAHHITSPAERLLLLCFHFDPSTGKYSATILQTLRVLVFAMLLAALALALPAFRRRRARRDDDQPRAR